MCETLTLAFAETPFPRLLDSDFPASLDFLFFRIAGFYLFRIAGFHFFRIAGFYNWILDCGKLVQGWFSQSVLWRVVGRCVALWFGVAPGVGLALPHGGRRTCWILR